MNAIKNNLSCGCSLPHGYRPLPIESEGGLERIMPVGVRVIFLGFDDGFRKKLAKSYRVDCPLDIFLSNSSDKKSTDVDKTGLDLKQLAKKVAERDFAAIAAEMPLAEDVRLVISDGAYSGLGKYIAKTLSLKHVICGGILSGHDFIFQPARPEGLINDGSTSESLSNCGVYLTAGLGRASGVLRRGEAELPAAFAFVMSCYFALFDWDISVLLFGGEACGEVFARAESCAMGLIRAVRTFSKRSTELKTAARAAVEAMSALVDTCDGRLLLSGATQAAAAFSMLVKREEREPLDIYDVAFLLSPLVARSYAAFLEKDILFSPPPDPSLRAERLTEYLGLSEASVYQMLLPQIPPATLKLADYRISVYRDRLLRRSHALAATLSEAYPAYFKLYPDDGFFLKGYISSLDSSLAIGLGPDCLKADTLLAYMRGKGVLDRLVL